VAQVGIALAGAHVLDHRLLAVELRARLVQLRPEGGASAIALAEEGGKPGVFDLRLQLDDADLRALHLHAQFGQPEVQGQQLVLDAIALPDHSCSIVPSVTAPMASVTLTESSTNCVMAASWSS